MWGLGSGSLPVVDGVCGVSVVVCVSAGSGLAVRARLQMTAWASAAMARAVLLSDRHVPARRAPLWRIREWGVLALVSPAVGARLYDRGVRGVRTGPSCPTAVD